MKWFGRWLLIGALAAGGWWLWQWLFVTDAQRVQRQLSAMAGAVEAGHWIQLDNNIANEYSDDFGFDKATVIIALRAFRAQYAAILILITNLKVEVAVDHQQAQAVFIAKILAKAQGSLSDSEVRADRYRVSFRRTADGWKLTRVESPQLKFD